MKIKSNIVTNCLLALATLMIFMACSNKKSESRDIQLLTDSSAYINNMYSDTSNETEVLTVPAATSRTPRSVVPQKSSAGQNTAASSTAPSTNSTGTETARKKGWSSAAKGAVIGAGAGAIGGAIISKKKPGQGAVIGGVVGAAGGYIIGKDIDKKKGR